jgi:hypothetical protein
MAHHGMKIYNNNTIMPSNYANLEVQDASYFPTPQAYNTNVVDRSHAVMLVLPSYVDRHNSYSNTDMSRWSSHNIYIPEHVNSIHNGFVPPYSLIVFASHCTPQTHMSMSNCYSRTDMRASIDFGQPSYSTPGSIGLDIAPNMFSAPHDVPSTFHSASPVYSRIDENSTNTPTSGTIRSDFEGPKKATRGGE